MITIRFEFQISKYLIKCFLSQVHFCKFGSQDNRGHKHLVSVALKETVFQIISPKECQSIDYHLIMNFFDKKLRNMDLLSCSERSFDPCNVRGSSFLLVRQSPRSRPSTIWLLSFFIRVFRSYKLIFSQQALYF